MVFDSREHNDSRNRERKVIATLIFLRSYEASGRSSQLSLKIFTKCTLWQIAFAWLEMQQGFKVSTFYIHLVPCIPPLQNMGTARVACFSGCRCRNTTIDGTWSKRASLMQHHSFEVSAQGVHGVTQHTVNTEIS